jgi:hypothetical protein
LLESKFIKSHIRSNMKTWKETGRTDASKSHLLYTAAIARTCLGSLSSSSNRILNVRTDRNWG